MSLSASPSSSLITLGFFLGKEAARCPSPSSSSSGSQLSMEAHRTGGRRGAQGPDATRQRVPYRVAQDADRRKKLHISRVIEHTARFKYFERLGGRRFDVDTCTFPIDFTALKRCSVRLLLSVEGLGTFHCTSFTGYGLRYLTTPSAHDGGALGDREPRATARGPFAVRVRRRARGALQRKARDRRGPRP